MAVCVFLAAGCAAVGTGIPPTETRAAVSPSPGPFLPQAETSVRENALPAAESIEAPSPTASREAPMKTQSPEPLIITILYNNIPFDARLQTDWGFSALVEYRNEILLFDTGGGGPILMGNMRMMGVDPLRIQDVVLSHAHSDHTGGLADFLKAAARPPVYLLTEFGSAMIRAIKDQTETVEVIPGMELSDGILTTGNVGGSIPEQSLVIRTQKGLVIITGCAHPGIVRILERAIELTGESVYLVLGGFHLRDMNDARISAILSDFRRLGVRKVAPSHCTGDRAIDLFAAEYRDDFLRTGAGSILRLDE
jgi:7,8-dihydropterin-6-yl-methyl-4-(beta-D-ribofuranosyl)aminobenzene 5'-phosphate synthase